MIQVGERCLGVDQERGGSAEVLSKRVVAIHAHSRHKKRAGVCLQQLGSVCTF
jgi:hypothetical protein